MLKSHINRNEFICRDDEDKEKKTKKTSHRASESEKGHLNLEIVYLT